VSVPARFLHISFHWANADKDDKVQPILNSALDWARYAPHCWVLWSGRDVDEWLKYLKPQLAPNDHVFIWQIDLTNPGITYTGWADKWFWEWVQKPR
jgi:hypothetical protein